VGMKQTARVAVLEWLFRGPGFSLFILLLTPVLGFAAVTYSARQQVRLNLLESRLSALSAVRFEVRENLLFAESNVRSIRMALLDVRSYPNLRLYFTAAWNSVSDSDGLMTVEPDYYVFLTYGYSWLEERNRYYLRLNEWMLIAPLEVREASKAVIDLEETNRVRLLRSLEKETLDALKKRLPAHIRLVELLLVRAKYDLDRARSAADLLLWGSAGVAVLITFLIMGLFFSGAFAVERLARAQAPAGAPTDEDYT
jgi:hypothetical protein